MAAIPSSMALSLSVVAGEEGRAAGELVEQLAGLEVEAPELLAQEALEPLVRAIVAAMVLRVEVAAEVEPVESARRGSFIIPKQTMVEQAARVRSTISRERP
jgi:hypothetical protein